MVDRCDGTSRACIDPVGRRTKEWGGASPSASKRSTAWREERKERGGLSRRKQSGDRNGREECCEP